MSTTRKTGSGAPHFRRRGRASRTPATEITTTSAAQTYRGLASDRSAKHTAIAAQTVIATNTAPRTTRPTMRNLRPPTLRTTGKILALPIMSATSVGTGCLRRDPSSAPGVEQGDRAGLKPVGVTRYWGRVLPRADVLRRIQ